MTEQPAAPTEHTTLRATVVLVVGVLALAATAWVGVYTGRGQPLDALLTGYLARPVPQRAPRLSGMMTADLCLLALVVAGCLWSAARRREWRLVALSALVAVGALATTEVLKLSVFERPDPGAGLNGLPSGHTTVVLSLVLVALLLGPARWRHAVAVAGMAGVTVMSAVLVTARWHRPSDILAACGVVAAWAGVAVLLARCAQVAADTADVTGGQSPREAEPSGELWLSMVLAGVLGVALVLLVGVRPAGGWWGLVPALFVLELLALAGGAAVALMAWATAGRRVPSTAP